MRDTAKQHMIGRSLPRVDIIEKVTGAARYSRDTFSSQALTVGLVGSPLPHLRIHRIDVTDALQVPGVVRVITAHDIVGTNKLPGSVQPYLAGVEARYQGEVVALVVARNQESALRATQRIRLDYEELPSAVDISSALAAEKSFFEETPQRNIWKRVEFQQGDPAQAFAEAPHVLEQTYTSQGQASDLLEPPSILAYIDAQDGLLLEGCTHHPYLIQAAVAQLLDLPYNRIQIMQHALRGTGQGYALRSTLFASYVALSTWLTGQSTRLQLTRSTTLQSFGQRPPAQIKIKVGANRNGEIQACESLIYLQMGAYPQDVEAYLHRTLAHACGPYHIPHVKISVVAVATNTPPVNLLPGYGQYPTCFARESLWDAVAQKLAMDPVEFRMKNVLRPGIPTSWGSPIDDIHGLTDVLIAAAQSSAVSSFSTSSSSSSTLSSTGPIPENQEGTKTKPLVPETSSGSPQKTGGDITTDSSSPESTTRSRSLSQSQEHVPWQISVAWSETPRRRKGWGVALEYTGLTTGGESSASQVMVCIHIQPDGTILLNVPQVDASSDDQTRLTQMTAEMLAAPFESIRLLPIDTTHLPAPSPMGLPLSILLTGQAVMAAARPLRERLLQQVAQVFQCPVEEVSTAVGGFYGPSQQNLPLAEVARLCWRHGVPLAEYGSFSYPCVDRSYTQSDSTETIPRNTSSLMYPAYSYAAHIAEVEIDLDSLEIEHISLYVACDIGQVINPMIARNQLIRETFRGLSYTFLTPAPVVFSGKKQGGFSIPHPLSITQRPPNIHPIVVEQSLSVGALGHKGFEALPAIGVAPAIANAISNALGQRVVQLPIQVEALLESLDTTLLIPTDSSSGTGGTA